MNGHFVPPEILLLKPLWLNFFNNMATVQFDHRMIAWLLFFLLPLLWWRSRAVAPSGRAPLAGAFMLGALGVQLALGIATLLHMVPLGLAAAHQAGAMVLFGAVLWVNHELRVPTASAWY
jgi:cytochrome c oxidase assembly protein subunit 15